MPSGMGLDGKMIPRRIKRMFDQRDEARGEAEGSLAQLEWRGQTIDVRLANLSSAGAMVIWDAMPHIGERVTFKLPDGRGALGDVRWVREGQVGIHFAAPLA